MKVIQFPPDRPEKTKKPSAESKVVVNRGLGLLPFLGIILVTLKATETIDWSWVWVLAPFWIPLIPLALMMAFGVLMLAFGALVLGGIGTALVAAAIYEFFKKR